MANRLPLIVNSDTEQIQELPIGDNLDIGDGDIVNVRSLVGNTVTASTVSIVGTLSVESIANVESISGNTITGNTITVSSFNSDSISLSGSADIAGNLEVGTQVSADSIQANTAQVLGNLQVSGNLSAANSAITANSIYAQSYFFANGAPFVSGGGGGGGGVIGITGNFDGGTPTSIYGGLPSIDGGGVVINE